MKEKGSNVDKVSAPLTSEKGGEADYLFSTTLAVRDYECDIEGIVNNANYLHYAEHTRHLFLKSIGVSFAKLHEQGTDPVVARMTLQYKAPLRCDDEFLSCLNLEKDGLRYIFHQDIYRLPERQLSFRAKVELVCLVNGRLAPSPDYDRAFASFIKNK